jgi:rare lipoprotein A
MSLKKPIFNLTKSTNTLPQVTIMSSNINKGTTPVTSTSGLSQIQQGVASWYGEKYRGKLTASGEKFNPDELTAASKKLPFGTLLKVTNPITRATVTVRINDRGPFVAGRDLDLSAAAARALGIAGIGKVTMEVLE